MSVRFARAVIVGVCLASPCPLTAATFVVDSTVDAIDASPGDGVCATASGSCTLRAAVQEANALAGEHQIRVPRGTYALTIPGADEQEGATGDLNIRERSATDLKSVSITGDGPSATIIDASAVERAFSGRGTTLTFADLTVQNGQRGCLRIVVSALGHLRLARVVVRGCRNASAVSIIGVYSSASTISESVITQNEGAAQGGGLSILKVKTVTIVRSSISGNSASRGGGIFVDGGIDDADIANVPAVTISVSSISDNHGAVAGGGIHLQFLTFTTILGSTVSGNSAPVGGGVYLSGALLGPARLTVTASTLASNTAHGSDGGGAMYVSAGYFDPDWTRVSINNSTITGNQTTAGSGSAVVSVGTVVELTYVTLTQNAAAIGGALSGGGYLRVSSTIVADNTPANCAESVTGWNYNLEFPGSSCGFDGSTDRRADPLLGPLADYGGPTQTHSIPRRSPAVDAGGGLACLDVGSRDQRGFLRAIRTPCDIGAYESAASGPSFTDEPLAARATPVKAVHLTELRARVDALRAEFSLLPVAWVDAVLTGVTVRAVHVQQMRDGVREAYLAAIDIGLIEQVPPFSDEPLSPQQTTIKAVHIEQLRAAIRALETG